MIAVLDWWPVKLIQDRCDKVKLGLLENQLRKLTCYK